MVSQKTINAISLSAVVVISVVLIVVVQKLFRKTGTWDEERIFEIEDLGKQNRKLILWEQNNPD